MTSTEKDSRTEPHRFGETSDEDLKRLSRGWSDDMTAAAIDRRLAKLAALYAAWKELQSQPETK